MNAIDGKEKETQMAERIPKGITADHCRRIRNLFRLIGSPNAIRDG